HRRASRISEEPGRFLGTGRDGLRLLLDEAPRDGANRRPTPTRVSSGLLPRAHGPTPDRGGIPPSVPSAHRTTGHQWPPPGRDAARDDASLLHAPGRLRPLQTTRAASWQT